ncbi:MAG: hypothetical protein WA136_14770 [Rhodoferax sp.]
MFAVTERDGDSEARLNALKIDISATPRLLEKHTIRARSEGTPKPKDPSRVGYVLQKPDGTKLTVDAHKEAKPRQLEIAADAMVSTGQKWFVAVDTAWSEIETSWQGFTWANRRVAEHRTLAQFPSKPSSVSDYEWEDRQKEDAFTTEEVLSFNLRRTGYSVATFTGVFAFVVIALAAIAWLWRALLARLRELSQAIRGEGPK